MLSREPLVKWSFWPSFAFEDDEGDDEDHDEDDDDRDEHAS